MHHPRLARLGLVVLLFGAGCTDGGDPTTPFDPSDPLHTVFDGSHDGLEGFNFLPPMVKDPAYGGTFDPGLSPVVEVCATVTCDALHASYSMTEGTGSERVRLVEQDGHYMVNWQTHATGAASGQSYRVRVVVSGVVLGYADVAVVSTGREAVEVRSDGLIALVANQTLPVKFRIETGIVGAVVVTPAEATIDIGASQRFAATLQDLHGAPLVGPTVTWASDDVGVATVDADGLATGLEEGEATITASAGPATGTALLTVSETAIEVSLVLSTITAGQAHSCGLDVGGDAYCWGWNVSGQLGDGTTTDRHTPVAVVMPEGVTFTSISGGLVHTVALASTGEVYAWGANFHGQLGDGTNTHRHTPVAVVMPAGVSYTSIGAGGSHTVALSSTGEAYAWGRGFEGQLGNGTNTSRFTPVAVAMPAGVTFTSVGTGYYHTVALAPSGEVYAWGQNLEGQLGDGTTTDRATPVAAVMPAGVTFTSISEDSRALHTVALASTGEAYAWGLNLNGQLGDGTTTNRHTPVAAVMPAGVSFKSISAGGDHTVALALTGEAYAWGRNLEGRLGDGTTTNRDTPVAVAMPAGVTFTAISAGWRHTVALALTGDVYAWGYNHAGQLGDGTTISRRRP